MAVIQAIPGAQFVLESVAIGTVVATAVAYRRKERYPDLDVAREVANTSAFALVVATLAQLLLLVLG